MDTPLHQFEPWLGYSGLPLGFEAESLNRSSACVIGPDILPHRMPSCTVQLDQHKMVAFKVSDFSFL
jgi:hypothetical protein